MITLTMMQNKGQIEIGQRYMDPFTGSIYRISNIINAADRTRKYVVKSEGTGASLEVLPRNGITDFVLLGGR